MYTFLNCVKKSSFLLCALLCVGLPVTASASEPEAHADDVLGGLPSERAEGDVERSLSPANPERLVLLQQAPRNQRPRTTTTAKKRQPVRQPPKNQALVMFWRIFPPPGRYTKEVGLSVGANFLETAYGGRNPNVIYRGHFGIRPMPNQLPLMVYGMADYSDYEQTAGPLAYTSRFFTLGAGAGFNYWLGPLRLDLLGEAGLLTRIATQTDGFSEPITHFNVQPVIGAVTGGALAIGGHVALSLRAAARMYDFGPSRVDLSVLYGLEWMIDAKPFRYY